MRHSRYAIENHAPVSNKVMLSDASISKVNTLCLSRCHSDLDQGSYCVTCEA